MREISFSEAIEQIKSRLDIVDVVGRVVTLKKAGSNYKGLCPFHNEKTPSFIVSPEKQLFTCFGCGITGDVFEFVKRTENLSFREAAEKLGSELGIEIQRTGGKIDEKQQLFYDVNRMAARYFYKELRNGDNPGIRYVIKRGISPETAKAFGIGYAKDGWNNLTDFFKSAGTQQEVLEELGLAAQGKKGQYDKFRNRVIFPIMNTSGKVIGFGGRAIGDETPKYLNSPETPIFKKKNNLYALNLAKKEISRQNLAILVEGYMDVVSLYQAGVENVVATLGTALTSEQASLLKRYTDQVVLAYDSDSAGQAAAFRGIDILQKAGLKVKILEIEGGKDPDEYIKKNGKEAFENLVKEAISFMEYKINGIKSKYDMNTTDGSIRFLEEISVELKKIESPVEQAAYVNLVSQMTHIPASSIQREIGRGGKPRPVPEVPIPEKEPGFRKKLMIEDSNEPLMRILIRLMIANGAYGELMFQEEEVCRLFEESPYKALVESIRNVYQSKGELELRILEDGLDEDSRNLLEEVFYKVPSIAEEEKTYRQCIKKLHKNRLERRRNQILNILEILDEEEDRDQLENLTKELMDISKLMNEK